MYEKITINMNAFVVVFVLIVAAVAVGLSFKSLNGGAFTSKLENLEYDLKELTKKHQQFREDFDTRPLHFKTKPIKERIR